jgi:ABC-type transport system involved in multi-copper enzyme maturation permease subunit
MTSIALRMFGADFLKVRKKRGIVIWSLVLTVGIVILVFAVTAIQHASNPIKHEPAGGMTAFRDGVRVIALIFGPLAAILIGVEAGTTDPSAGVFRDLVVTGRSRLALFASRVPAALAVCWMVILSAYLLLIAGVFLFSSSLPTPNGALLFNGLLFVLMATGVICAISVGFASLTTSRPGAIIALIAWQIVASPILLAITSLGSARKGLLSQAIAHFSPVSATDGGRGTHVSMSEGTALIVMLIWLVVFLALGAWRTRTMDA